MRELCQSLLHQVPFNQSNIIKQVFMFTDINATFFFHTKIFYSDWRGYSTLKGRIRLGTQRSIHNQYRIQRKYYTPFLSM